MIGFRRTVEGRNLINKATIEPLLRLEYQSTSNRWLAFGVTVNVSNDKIVDIFVVLPLATNESSTKRIVFVDLIRKIDTKFGN